MPDVLATCQFDAHFASPVLKKSDLFILKALDQNANYSITFILDLSGSSLQRKNGKEENIGQKGNAFMERIIFYTFQC